MINVTAQGHDAAIKALANVTTNLTKQIGIASWQAAKFGKSHIAKEIGKELATPQKDIKKDIDAKRAGGTRATVTLDKSKRMSLKRFKPKQNATGVAYKISKTEGRKKIPGAFMGPRPGAVARKLHGHVWMRSGARVAMTKGASKGQSRQRIYKLYGPSPWGVVVTRDKQLPIGVIIKDRYGQELEKRLRYLRLKQSGVI